MKKIVSIVFLVIIGLFLSNTSKADIFIYNNTPIQHNFHFNNGYICGISATSPFMNVFTGPGTSYLDFISVGGINASFVKTFPGLTPHTPAGAPMDVLYVGGPLSGFPSSSTTYGQYGLMSTTYTVEYYVVGMNIFININPV